MWIPHYSIFMQFVYYAAIEKKETAPYGLIWNDFHNKLYGKKQQDVEQCAEWCLYRRNTTQATHVI